MRTIAPGTGLFCSPPISVAMTGVCNARCVPKGAAIGANFHRLSSRVVRLSRLIDSVLSTFRAFLSRVCVRHNPTQLACGEFAQPLRPAMDAAIGTKSRKKLQSRGRVFPAMGWWALGGMGSEFPLDRHRETCDGWSIRIVLSGRHPIALTRTTAPTRIRTSRPARGDPEAPGGTDGHAALLLRHLR